MPVKKTKATKINDTGTYRYGEAKRKNLATEQTEPHMAEEDRAPRQFTPEVRSIEEEPRLAWWRKTTADSPHDAYPLIAREKLHPGVFARWLQYGAEVETTNQGALPTFHDFNGLPSEEAKYQWYQHDADWSNRLIHGESSQVMASLLEHEQMAGTVQMIYFDPPYGMNFNSNFQPSSSSPQTKPKDKPNDSSTVRAFSDTYERLIHSYFDQMLEKLALCENLLHESGSIFVQIGDENVHRLALLMDEVFGAENRVVTIPFVTTGGSSANTLPSVADYLLWYAKDKNQVKFNQPYGSSALEEKIKLANRDFAVELPDGTTRRLKAEEKKPGGLDNLPKGKRFVKLVPLASMGEAAPGQDGERGRSEDYILKDDALVRELGVSAIACPKGRQWRVSHEGLDCIQEKGRMFISTDKEGKQNLWWKHYFEELPGKRLHNTWSDMAKEDRKRYVVQTAEKTIRRAMLMSTDPGDLVLDITCGSGTTAVVAEEWGRRWITCDTSAVAVSLARQRIATRPYTYWVLSDTKEGRTAEDKLVEEAGGTPDVISEPASVSSDPSQGFVYERVPYVSAKTLAYDLPQEYTYLVDRPVKAKGKVRVASPFAVESPVGSEYDPLWRSRRSKKLQKAQDSYVSRAVQYFLSEGAVSTDGDLSFEINSITELENPQHVTHEVTYKANGGFKKAGMLLAPSDVRVSRFVAQKAATETRKHFEDADVLFVVAYESELGSKAQGHNMVGNVQVVHVRPNRDLAEKELTHGKGHRAFTVLGEPDVAISESEEETGSIVVELLGFDAFDPATGETTHSENMDDIACWMIDTDFDGTNFFARRLHFPANGEKDLEKLAKHLKVDTDTVRFQSTTTTTSAPFKRSEDGRGIAVRIVTTTGDEMTVEIDDIDRHIQQSTSI